MGRNEYCQTDGEKTRNQASNFRNVVGIPYIISSGETGILADVGDHKNLAAQALSVLEDSELSGKIIANARRECEKYSWENVRREWLLLYRKLKKEKHGT